MSGSGSDSPNDPFVDEENAVIAAAHRLHLLGVPVEERTDLIRYGVTLEQQWNTLRNMDKGGFMSAAQNKLSFNESQLNSRLGEYLLKTPTLDIDPDEMKFIVQEEKDKLIGNIMANYYRQSASGEANFELTSAEVKSFVDAQFSFYDKMATAADPHRVLERRNKIMLEYGKEKIAKSGTIMGRLMSAGVDAEQALEVQKSILDVEAKYGKDALSNPSIFNKMTPQEQAMITLSNSLDPQQYEMGTNLMQNAWREGGVPGGIFGAKMATLYAKHAIQDGPNSKVEGAWDSWRNLAEKDGHLLYDAVIDWVPTSTPDGSGIAIDPQVNEGLQIKMERDEIEARNILHGNAMFGFGGEFFNTTGAEKKWSLQYDGKSDSFVVVDSDGNITDGSGKVSRQAVGLNKIYRVRKKLAMWDGKGSYQDKQGFIEWATNFNVIADDDGVPVSADRDFEQEVYSKMNNDIVRRTIIESEGGYQNDKSDKGNWTGGAIGVGKNLGTNMGITPVTLAAARGVGVSELTEQDMKDLTPEEAEKIYLDSYYNGPKIDKLPGENLQGIVFDMGVVMGPKRAISLLQEALGVSADGVLGPETLFAARNVDLSTLYDVYKSYFKTVATRGENQKFLRGWMNRLGRTFATYDASNTRV
jgi:lysozyme family protein